MKISASLPDADVEFLDGYTQRKHLESRSAALHKAIRLLRASELGADYESAWKEWEGSEDAVLWESSDEAPRD